MYTWALVIFMSVNPSNFTIHDKFYTVEECVRVQQNIAKGLEYVKSNMRAVCRPIAK